MPFLLRGSGRRQKQFHTDDLQLALQYITTLPGRTRSQDAAGQQDQAADKTPAAVETARAPLRYSMQTP